ncbi:hypothetical protein ACFFV7_47175 [Nonomuraea spiralis]|uniref:Uncharacterized protein n=1 Tax=Nonomuraea spiralis TaxID=46182 RepID=A0ABV5IX46_9ACTN|nr:hypothetical protein [Nonomuraea spiralis]GGS85436.1 hypothetical protein GCM10010176_031470 [Nonomuraea spiralis]
MTLPATATYYRNLGQFPGGGHVPGVGRRLRVRGLRAHSRTAGRTLEAKPLPLLAARYAPADLDAFSRARSGTVTRVPVRVERNPGASQAQVTSLRLEMSFDDGASRLPVPAVPAGSGWTAAVPNPRTAGFVSLRATAGPSPSPESGSPAPRAKLPTPS